MRTAGGNFESITASIGAEANIANISIGYRASSGDIINNSIPEFADASGQLRLVSEGLASLTQLLFLLLYLAFHCLF